MKVRSRTLRPFVAGIAVMCAAVFVTGVHTAHAGINVRRSRGPETKRITALAIDPTTAATPYAWGRCLGTRSAGD